jgi:hypothetical protein
MTPVLRCVRETVEATAAAWQKLDPKDLLPADISEVIGRQIDGAARRTLKGLA